MLFFKVSFSSLILSLQMVLFFCIPKKMKVNHSQLFFWELKKTLQAKNTKYNPIKKKTTQKTHFYTTEKSFYFSLN